MMQIEEAGPTDVRTVVHPLRVASGLLATSHPGPAVVVTTIVALLAVAADRSAGTVALVAAAVLCGQLTVGWVNDLVDVRRDRAVGRSDKPLATGRVAAGTVVVALVLAGAACVVLSAAAGWRSAAVHLLLVVGAAQAYNLGVKATAASWLPYAVAFGALPAVASLAGDAPAVPAWWTVGAGAALGVGAHVLNALPDLDDDLRTDVRGMPHRVGRGAARPLAAGLLLAASLLAGFGPSVTTGGAPAAWVWVALAGVGALVLVASVTTGRTPFRAAMAVAVLDVVLLVAVG